MKNIIAELNNKDYLLNKVAAGLRRMDKKPDALLYFDKQDSFYDRDKILDIPVYRTEFVYQGNGQDELQFYPLFLNPDIDYTIDVSNFRRGYEDF